LLRKYWQYRRHSLSAKLVILFLLVGFLFVILLGMAIKKSFHNSFQDSIQPHLIAYMEYVKNDIGLPPDLSQAKMLSDRLAVDIIIIGENIRWSSSEKFFPIKDLEIHRQFIRQGQTIIFAEYQEKDILVLEHGNFRLFFSNVWQQDAWHSAKALPFIVFIVVLVLLYHVISYLFSPLKCIQAGIKEISQGNLEHKIVVKRKDELAELAENINIMGDDIKQMLEAKRQLLLAISHELRSPLTRAKIQVEMLTDQKQRHDLQDDLNEMADLIEELLEGERLNSNQSLTREKLLINELVEELLSARFSTESIKVKLPDEPIYITADRTRLRLLLKNLLDNALRFTPPDHSTPEILIWKNTHYLYIQIVDHGEGVAAEHLSHLCEPFYRADPSRQRKTGGYGLGLYLCRMIAEAHGGSLQLKSEINKGTTAEIQLPTP